MLIDSTLSQSQSQHISFRQEQAAPHLYYLRATHAAKAIRVFLRMRDLRFVRIEVLEFGFGLTSEDLLAESFACLPNIHHGCTREVGAAGLRDAIAAIHLVAVSVTIVLTLNENRSG